jgi:hypothetical protein
MYFNYNTSTEPHIPLNAREFVLWRTLSPVTPRKDFATFCKKRRKNFYFGWVQGDITSPCGLQGQRPQDRKRAQDAVLHLQGTCVP